MQYIIQVSDDPSEDVVFNDILPAEDAIINILCTIIECRAFPDIPWTSSEFADLLLSCLTEE